MGRVFLSHSSKQKGYVEIVAKILGKQQVVYDAWTFEEGCRTLDEIYRGIDQASMFVFFISEASLTSKWVEKEILQAEEYIRSGRIKSFFPVIIDDTILHSDERIPEWMRTEYNLRYISKPTKVAALIRQRQRLLAWDLFPQKRDLDQLFVGRTSQLREFESRIYDIDNGRPTCVVVSGLSAIGRRKFLRHALINSSTIRPEYRPFSITLDSMCSIEDFILRMYGLGYSSLPSERFSSLLSKSMSEKVSIAIALILELESVGDLLFVEDNNAIVSKTGKFPEWFLGVIDGIAKHDSILLCIISLSKVKTSPFILRQNNLFCVNIPELDRYERIGLFTNLLKINDLSLDKDDVVLITNMLNGYPEQVQYAVQLLKYEGLSYVKSHLNEIVEYNTEKVSHLVRKYESNDLAINLLKILSEYEFISYLMLEKILGEDFESAMDIVEDLSSMMMVECIGTNKENLRLNDVIRDYIQRSSYKLNDRYRDNLIAYVNEQSKNYLDDIERDTSDYVISLKESLKQGKGVPDEFLIPSHFVNAMRELYNYERRYDEVIALADRVLMKSDYMDDRIIREIRYWLCLSLARKGDERFLKEVDCIKGAENDFLRGFYYRFRGQMAEALRCLNRALEQHPEHIRAKRELIQVYLNKAEYDEAYELAKELYHVDKNNPYAIQSYFRCVLELDGKSATATLKKLLEDLKANLNPKADEMYRTAMIDYAYYIEDDLEKALQIADNTIQKYSKKIYPYLAKLGILNQIERNSERNELVQLIDRRFDQSSDIRRKLQYLMAKCSMLKENGLDKEARQLVSREVKGHFSAKVVARFNAILSK